jgi:hypothetical protein
MTTPISPELQKVLDEYATTLPGGKTSNVYLNVQEAITGSSYLAQQMNASAQSGDLKHIAARPLSNEGAHYESDNKTMVLNSSAMSSKLSASDEAVLVFQMGHENQHALYSQTVGTAEKKADQDLDAIAASKGTQHDYTSVVSSKNKISSVDEAQAHLAGWNAAASYIREKDPKAGIEKIANQSGYALNFMEGDKPRSNLNFNPDMSLTMTPQNVAAMEKDYFQQPPNKTRLGPHGDLDYSHYYAAYTIQHACAMDNYNHALHPGEPRPELQLNMKALGLDPALIQSAGLSLPGGRYPYTDISDPSKPVHRELTGSVMPGQPFAPVGQALPGDAKQASSPQESGQALPSSPEKHGSVNSAELLKQPLDSNSSRADVARQTFAALMGDDDRALNRALNTDTAKQFFHQAETATAQQQTQAPAQPQVQTQPQAPTQQVTGPTVRR